MLKGSPLRSQRWDLSKIQTHISFYVCPHYLQVWKGSDQKQPRKRDDFVFPIISAGNFFRRSRAANSVVGGQIWPKFALIQDIMHVLITCKIEKDRINSNGEKSGDLDFLDAQGQLTP